MRSKGERMQSNMKVAMNKFGLNIIHIISYIHIDKSLGFFSASENHYLG
jgi:hypothetical protein